MAAINDWMQGDGTDGFEGDTLISDEDTNLTNYLQDPLDRTLRSYRRGALVLAASNSTVTVMAGELMLSNSDGSANRMRRNTSALTLDITSDLDTGSEQASQQYYVWALADANATTFTGVISESDTVPTGGSYYRLLGYFYNNASSNIVSVGNKKEGDSCNAIQAIGTSDITTTSTTFIDMTDMVVYFVSSGRPVKIGFAAPFLITGSMYGVVAIDIDGTDKVETSKVHNDGSGAEPDQDTMSLIYLENLTAGTHTIKIQWKITSSTFYQYGATRGDRVLIVEEL